MPRQVVLQPLVLGAARRPMGVVVVLVGAAGAGVAVGPGGGEYIEARGAGVEGVPGTGIVGRGRVVDAAVGVANVAPIGGADGAVLRPIQQVRVVGIGARKAVV